jgi:2-polyprenyl-3-methyl-5-hydroxy-6-metoxy-1,4-benzoquinol methylase
VLNELVYDFPRDDLLPHLPPRIGTVLDIGCGGGAFGRSLKAAQPDAVLIGVEPDPLAAERARAEAYQYVATGFFPEVLEDLPHRAYDAICFMDVLEHMPDPHAALRAAAEVLAPGGVIYASIPNVRHLSVWWPLVHRGDWTYTDTGLMDRTHIRWFTESSIRRMFEESGLQVQTLKGINRARRGAGGEDGWKLRMLSTLTRGRSDPFFWVQYFVSAQRPPEAGSPTPH